MKVIHIIKENDNADDIMSALSSLVSVLKTKGHKNIPTQYAVNYINNMGYNVEAEALVSVANHSPFVSSATEEEISIGNDVMSDAEGGEDANMGQDVVDQMATDAAMGDITQ